MLAEDLLKTTRAMAEAYDVLRGKILTDILHSRGRSLALTNLDQSELWALATLVPSFVDTYS